MRLEDIGFYTLKDNRAKNTSINSPLWRCEMILTNKCNFKCVYCRKFSIDDIPKKEALNIIKLWSDQGLKNIRFSGGEPTLYPDLLGLVFFAKECGIERIALSTNGSASLEIYLKLIFAGINDFSISLDSCCVSVSDKMSGADYGMWDHVTHIIKMLSYLTYVTIGIVINEENINHCVDTIVFCDELGVSDIRIIPSAQFNQMLPLLKQVPGHNMLDHPILNYRIINSLQGKSVRGIQNSDSHKCFLVLDDMAVMKNSYLCHYPCIIYLREGGNPIGKIGKNMRKDRLKWMLNNNTHLNPICKKNCLDVCIEYNNKVRDYKLDENLSF